jgi:hypothetical protein
MKVQPAEEGAVVLPFAAMFTIITSPDTTPVGLVIVRVVEVVLADVVEPRCAIAALTVAVEAPKSVATRATRANLTNVSLVFIVSFQLKWE